MGRYGLVMASLLLAAAVVPTKSRTFTLPGLVADHEQRIQKLERTPVSGRDLTKEELSTLADRVLEVLNEELYLELQSAKEK